VNPDPAMLEAKLRDKESYVLNKIAL